MRTSLGRRLASGAAGALATTLVHQALRTRVRAPPRMDLVGMRLIRRGFRRLGARPPRGLRLYNAALAAELAGNACYYSLAPGGRPLTRGTTLGVLAGVGAVAHRSWAWGVGPCGGGALRPG